MAEAHQHGHSSGGAGESIQVGILTCSDRGSRGERADVSGPTLHNLIVDRLGAQVAQYKVVPDDRGAIEAVLTEWADETRLDIIFTTGGTGFSPRRAKPEAGRVARAFPSRKGALRRRVCRRSGVRSVTRDGPAPSPPRPRSPRRRGGRP